MGKKSIKELIALLDILDEDETALAREVTYNVINAIEWLTYLIPKMYGALLSNSMGSSLYEDLVERLEKYIIGEKYKLAIRMEAAWALGWASVSSIGVATCVHQYEKSTQSRVDRIQSNVLRHVVSTAYLRASFTLVSFGPARVASSMVEPLPGAYLPDQMPAQVNPSIHDYARRAAADIVYSELKQMVRWDILVRLRFATLAASWLVINDLISVFLSLKFIIVIWFAIVPILILLINVILLMWRWGKGYQWQIVTVWAMFLLLAASPWISLVSWQQAFIIAGAFIAFLTAIFGIVSSWLSVFAVLLGLVRFLRTKLNF